MRQLLPSLFFGLLVAACPAKTKSPSDTTPKETTLTAANVTPKETAPPPVKATPMTFTISPESSSISFIGAKTTQRHEGKFASFSGEVYVPDQAHVESSSVSVELKMSEFETDFDALTMHLKTSDFFDVERFPVARFTSTKVEPSTQEGATHLITGDLDFHGVKRSLTFPAKIAIVDGALDASSEFSFNRKDFGVVYPGMASDLIKDEVVLKVSLRASAK